LLTLSVRHVTSRHYFLLTITCLQGLADCKHFHQSLRTLVYLFIDAAIVTHVFVKCFFISLTHIQQRVECCYSMAILGSCKSFYGYESCILSNTPDTTLAQDMVEGVLRCSKQVQAFTRYTSFLLYTLKFDDCWNHVIWNQNWN
jgi:hypothetical protein